MTRPIKPFKLNAPGPCHRRPRRSTRRHCRSSPTDPPSRSAASPPGQAQPKRRGIVRFLPLSPRCAAKSGPTCWSIDCRRMPRRRPGAPDRVHPGPCRLVPRRSTRRHDQVNRPDRHLQRVDGQIPRILDFAMGGKPARSPPAAGQLLAARDPAAGSRSQLTPAAACPQRCDTRRRRTADAGA